MCLEEKLCNSIRDFNSICTKKDLPTLIYINIRNIEKNLENLIIQTKELNFFPGLNVLKLSEIHSTGKSNYSNPKYSYYTTITKINKYFGIEIFISKQHNIVNIKEIIKFSNFNILNIEITDVNTFYNFDAIYCTHKSIVRGQWPLWLDHIFTNIPYIINITSAVIHTTTIDHYSCISNYNYIISYSVLNMDMIKYKLEQENWNKLLCIILLLPQNERLYTKRNRQFI